MVRVRFAPSPTGSLHLGGLRTALYNWLFARHENGTFILRIEDTDRARAVPQGVEQIVETLAQLDLLPDEGVMISGGQITERGNFGPYIQSKALETYRRQAEWLISQGSAYWCHCQPARLAQLRENLELRKLPTRYDGQCRELKLGPATGAVVRLKTPSDAVVEFQDIIHGKIKHASSELDDQVLLKSDGYPTYHLANVVDDHRMEISHVIRGDEWLPSTPKHVLLYQAFGWSSPQFAHLPLLLAPGGGKLSKRTGEVSVEDFLKRGYLPEALINFVALLGWNPSGERDLYRRQELADSFDLSKINRHGVAVDTKKLDAINRHYLQRLELEQLKARATPFLSPELSQLPTEVLSRLLTLEQGRISRLDELVNNLSFVNTPLPTPTLFIWKKSNKDETLQALKDLKKNIEEWGSDIFENQTKLERETKNWIQRTGKYESGTVLWPFRVALSHAEKSPSPFELAQAWGKEETLRRLKNAIQCLES